MRGQERSTAWLSSVPSAGYVTATNQKYSGLNIRTLVSFSGQVGIKNTHIGASKASGPTGSIINRIGLADLRALYSQSSHDLVSKATTPLEDAHHQGSTKEPVLQHGASTSLNRLSSKLGI